MEYYRANEPSFSQGSYGRRYGPMVGLECEKVRKRREADAKCRANIAECYRQLKGHIHIDAKLSKARVLQESLRKIHYLEAIVSLQLMNLQKASTSPSWNQVSIQSMHQEFIKGYNKGFEEMKKKAKKAKKVYPSYRKVYKDKPTKVRYRPPRPIYTDQVVPSSPAVHMQSRNQVETIRQSTSWNVNKTGGYRNTCITPDLTCNEEITEEHENTIDMFCTPRHYRLILPNNAPRKSKPLDDGQKQNYKKRKLDFGQSDDHIVAMFRNKKRKTGKSLKKQNTSARTRPWVWIRIIRYDKQSDGSSDEEDIDVVGDFQSNVSEVDDRLTPGEFEGIYLQQMNNMPNDDDDEEDDDDGILSMILEMENEFSNSNSGFLDTFMGNDEEEDFHYGIMTSTSPSNESSSLSSPVRFTEVTMDSDFFNSVRNSDFQLGKLHGSDTAPLSPSDNNIFCFENDEDLSSGDLMCYEDLPKGSFSLYSPQKTRDEDLESAKYNVDEMVDAKQSIMRWFSSVDNVYHKDRKVNFSSLDYSPGSISSTLHNQVVPQWDHEDKSFEDVFADDNLTASMSNYPSPSKLQWFLGDADPLTCYEGINDI